MTRQQLDVDFFDPALVQNPFDAYEEIRATGRAVWNEVIHGWMVPGFDDCATVLSDHGQRFAAVPASPEVLPWFEASTMISVDGGTHRRLRGCLAPLFTRRRPAGSRGCGPWSTSSSLPDFTMIPTIIVAEMLDVPAKRHGDFRHWSNTIVSHLSWGHEDPATRAALIKAGPHLCLGAPLARLESRVAIEQLLRRAPEYRLRDMKLGPSFFVRGPDRGFLDVAGPA